MIPRFHCPVPLAPGALVELPAAIAHHALKVLRMKDGDALVLFDGTGGEWRATLKVGRPLAAEGAPRSGGEASASGMRDAGFRSAADPSASSVASPQAGPLLQAPASPRGTALALLHEFEERESESPLAVTLVQALPAGDKMDWVVEKCIELGVAAIQPVAAKRSVMRLTPDRMARRIAHWNAIARAACEQCGRNRVPPVLPVLDLPQYLAQTQTQNACRLLLSPHGSQALRAQAKPAAPIVAMIGPEGGWDEGEIAAARAAGFAELRLGPRVLRTETAGAALLAALQALWGDF
ncbi:MAG: 16S rRNA (uracil(1498)-N(3))-methyltransferase [Rhodocyclaceae bacterium]|jgi:16S rRNA (uracil1498-N3)-methyltransferase|nr:16S rRNA (uracil(1498)-N(3))-methyltransferase [Rhodocyclaceae bacterium]NWG32297.1 16S rRNA (uracil(1498)-N(3))-methyltransferase [Rhodocyclaceae bacterium]